MAGAIIWVDYDNNTLHTLEQAFKNSPKLNGHGLEVFTECNDALSHIAQNNILAVICEYMIWDENGGNIPYGIEFLKKVKDKKPEIKRALCFDPEYAESINEKLPKDLADILIKKPLRDRNEAELRILELLSKR